MGAEKRTSLRIPLSVNVTYRVGEQERAEAYRVCSVNIGEGGIFLETDLPLGIGTEVHLEFSLPGSTETLRFDGKVVWSGEAVDEAGGHALGKGIEFTECDDQCRAQIMQFIAMQGPTS
jgi:type IV pilus assembly protein PilZ